MGLFHEESECLLLPRGLSIYVTRLAMESQ